MNEITVTKKRLVYLIEEGLFCPDSECTAWPNSQSNCSEPDCILCVLDWLKGKDHE